MIKERKKIVFNWSGGKDSALALNKIMQDDDFEVVSLLTTANSQSRRSTMHGIPVALLERQAASIGVPLYVVDLTPKGDMSDYEDAMTVAVNYFKEQGVNHFAFGDIFLHDVRSYREKQLSPHGIEVVEPLWNKSSEEIMAEFLSSGLQTVVVTVTEGVLDKSFVGKTIDENFAALLPDGVDVCGENGEYHTFCYGGGMFRQPVPFTLGEAVRATYSFKHEDGNVHEYSYWFANLQE